MSSNKDGIRYIVKPAEGVVIGICKCYTRNLCPEGLNEFEFRVFWDALLYSPRLWHYRQWFEIKAIARCNMEEDVFDEEFGKKLVEARIEKKKHEAALKIMRVFTEEMTDIMDKLTKSYNEHLNKERRIEIDLINYFGLEGV